MRLCLPALFTLIFLDLGAQPFSGTFEMRYFTRDNKADGETDFKGETEWMDTEKRIGFLEKYADFASQYFNNNRFDKEIVTDADIREVLSKYKTPPLTNIRKTIPLNEWKSYGYKAGQDSIRQLETDSWLRNKGCSLQDGYLVITADDVRRNTDSLNWRFRFECRVSLQDSRSSFIKFNSAKEPLVVLEMKKGEISYGSGKMMKRETFTNSAWTELIIEGDMTQNKYNLYADGRRIAYYVPMMNNSLHSINEVVFAAEGKIHLDDIILYNYKPTANVNFPYSGKILIDENFEEKSGIRGWQSETFNDSHWVNVNLPAVHGGLKEAEESLYLRKKVRTDDFDQATLMIETIDPGGEVWINNAPVAVITTRHPVELDISRFLEKNTDNLIAVRVKPYKLRYPSAHAPTDRNIGWFLGRANLVLSSKCMIKEVLVSTEKIGEQAIQSHRINIWYNSSRHLDGSIEINYYPWFPNESGKVATVKQEVRIRPRIISDFDIKCTVPSPRLWSCDSPALYRVEVILKDADGKPVDDFMTTTGIRTIEQRNGDFYFNGRQEMLNGAQIMGFRTPIETMAKYHRCAKWETIAEELLMIKKMNGNLIRMHVHAEGDTTDGINDPRYAELADQIGMNIMWSTSAWTRTSSAWNVDFEGYPLYMKQVFNHPSITIWEASNHPNKFKEFDLSESNDYVKRIYHTIASTDQSRLISPTTFWQHLHYGNYEGTVDYKGNPITAVPEYLAPLVTRGSQDAYSGYGATWTSIRKLPNKWAESCLKSREKAYFNFEHEESIGQPNWELCKGKPWYLMQSYEWDYDVGSIGRRLTTDEWKASQAWQAFAAWESMKKQILVGYDGFSWCCLHGGPNMGTYQKPLIDNERHPKLSFYINKMIFQRTWAGSNNVDVVYGPADKIIPVINHIGEEKKVNLVVELKTPEGKIIDKKIFKDIHLESGHSMVQLEGFRFRNNKDGIYAITYNIYDN